MKKKFKLFCMISIALVYAVFLTILFVALPDNYSYGAQFIIGLVFGFIVPIILSEVLVFFLKRESYELIAFLPFYIVILVFDVIAIIINMIFICIEQSEERITTEVILNLVLLVIFWIVFGLLHFAAKYITDNDKRQKGKVFYIRNVQLTINQAKNIVEDLNVKNNLSQLEEDIRFSDPMSHSSLRDLERQIEELAEKILRKVNADPEEVNFLIKDARNKIKLRNERCRILK